MAKAQLRCEVYGLVQGVSFRWATRGQAVQLGVTGWVQNRPDGSVALLAEGTREQLERLLAWVHRGPPSARVERVDVKWDEPSGEASSFEIR